MKEFQLQWNDMTKGISPTPQQSKNSAFLTDAYGVKIGKYGVEAQPTISSLSSMPSVIWPFPQVVKTSVALFVLSGTKMYEMDSVGNLIERVGSFVSVGQWDVADFLKYQVWTDGTNLIVRDHGAFLALRTGDAYVPKSVCAFRGQMILGGLGTNKDWLAWSNIGHVDLTTLLGAAYGLSSTDVKNTAGNMKMPYSGQVHKVLSLGEAVIAYGENGSIALLPATSPAPGYGVRELGGLCISQARAVGGDLNKHLIVDSDGYVWTIGADLKVERLGYNRLFAGQTVSISHDDLTGDFYISTSSNTYLLSAGLSRLDRILTSAVRFGGDLLAAYTNQASADCLLVSDIIDMGLTGIKTVTAIEVGTDSEDVYVAVDYRYRNSGNFTTSRYKQVYRNGMVFPIISGTNFRVRVKGTDPTDFSISYVNIKWKLSDKRAVRGTYADDKNVS